MKKTSEKIVEYIETKGQVTPGDLSDHLGINRQATHRQINKLIGDERIYKIGKSPRVYYLIKDKKREDFTGDIDDETKKIVEENFLVITPSGERKEGLEGFIYWCDKQKLPIEKTATEYKQTLLKYTPYKKDGLIDGMYKIKKMFSKVFLDKLYYLDFYSIERFGKTKLGQLLLYAKQSQNKVLIKELIEKIKPKIDSVIEKFEIDAIGFIPPTVKREVQLMKELEKHLNLPIPTINIVKVKTPIAVAQKTLHKLEDRIENAKNTIIVDDSRKYKNILLIDDALGSGATLNETSSKIRNLGLAEKIVGLAITGSFSGFEIINEV
ncbi:MAG TPA: winged helix-turn-helix transcriptional regulator [Candidatus Paceibacterota bacterium]